MKENELACKREKESVTGEDDIQCFGDSPIPNVTHENQPIYINPDKITHKKRTGRYPWGERRNED